MTVRLHHASIIVRDLAQSLAFYTELFELTPLERPTFPFAGAWLGCADGTQVHLVVFPTGTFRSAPKVDADWHFAFSTDDFEGMLTRLRHHGFREDVPDGDLKRLIVLRGGAAGFEQAYLLDPDRNIVEVNTAGVAVPRQ